VDTPAALTEIVLAAFDVSEHLFSLATVDLPSVRNLGVLPPDAGEAAHPVRETSH